MERGAARPHGERGAARPHGGERGAARPSGAQSCSGRRSVSPYFLASGFQICAACFLAVVA